MKPLKYLFLIPCAANLAGHLTGVSWLHILSKPLLMPLLALSVWLWMKEHGVRGVRTILIPAALTAGTLGDVLLMFHGSGPFMAGMTAFFLGHILYFCALPAPWKAGGISGKLLTCLLFALLLAGVLSLAGGFSANGAMGVCVRIYAGMFALLVATSVAAALLRGKPCYLVTALGFLLFAFSDYFVAQGAFSDVSIPMRGFVVMSSYIVAQAVIAFSLAAEEIMEWERTEYGVRVRRLYSLRDALMADEDAFVHAFEEDFGKGEFEAYTTEIGFLYNDIRYTISHLRDWMEPRAVSTPFILWPGRSRIFPEPYGKVLIIGPFNYPLHLVVAPLAAAIAAGNTAVVKPSRQTPSVSAILSSMLRDTFPPEVVEVAEEGISNEELLSRKYDYIFFTGSPRVGKIVMEAASKHLTPVTLELGGKSPAIVCPDAPLRLACERIAKGKFINAGQTCVAPDYVLVHESVHDEFISTIRNVIGEFYGNVSVRPEEMTLMATERHFSRVASLIPDDKPAGAGPSVAAGGFTDPELNYISPTVLDGCSWNDPAMREEIFGPVLPVLTFKDLQADVIDRINAGEKPLALYLFTKDRLTVRTVMSSVSFGGGCVNDTIMHLGNENLPFGGVGNSGMGAYHGKTGFETFSHMKSMLLKPSCLNFDLLKPPYGRKLRLIRNLYR